MCENKGLLVAQIWTTEQLTHGMLQAGNVVEEGSHTELWNQSDSVYHSLVALQEAATDKNDQLTAEDLQVQHLHFPDLPTAHRLYPCLRLPVTGATLLCHWFSEQHC